jgi:methylthioribose-1-phosphate isomerase
MSLTVTELAEEVRDTHRELTGAIKELRIDVSALRVDVGKINTSLNWAKGIGAILAGSAVTVLILAFNVAHRATQLEDAVVELQKNSSETRKDSRVTAGQLERALSSLERIEKTLAQAAPAKSAVK